MFERNPEKYEAKALQYERRGKLAKANKYRAKAARIRGTPSGIMAMTAPYASVPGQAPVSLAQGSHIPVGTGVNPALLGTTTTTTSYNNVGALPHHTVGNSTTPFNTPVTVGPSYGTPYSQRAPAVYEQNALKWEQRNNYMKAQKNREKVWRIQNPQYVSSPAPVFYQNNRFTGYNAPAPVQYEVQPIIHRTVEAPQVRVIEQHIYETIPSGAAGMHTQTRQPIVQETVVPKIIEEIQPILHREVAVPVVERVEQHTTEHLVRPTTTSKEVVTEQRGFAAGGPIVQGSTTTTTTNQRIL